MFMFLVVEGGIITMANEEHRDQMDHIAPEDSTNIMLGMGGGGKPWQLQHSQSHANLILHILKGRLHGTCDHDVDHHNRPTSHKYMNENVKSN